jgi:hypothetical protein
MILSRRTFAAGVLAAGAAAGLSVSRGASAQGRIFTPEMFGAAGDGVTNDTAAFNALAEAVNRNGGGTVRLRRATYIVGAQNRSAPGSGWSFAPVPLMEFRGCSGPLTIEGNGAVLRCAGGLRFGTFNRNTGAPTRYPQPYYDRSEISTPYSYMVLVEKKRRDLTLADPWYPGRVRHTDIVWPDDLDTVRTHLRWGTNDYTGVSTAKEGAERGTVYVLDQDSASPHHFYDAGFKTEKVKGYLYELVPPGEARDGGQENRRKQER